MNLVSVRHVNLLIILLATVCVTSGCNNDISVPDEYDVSGCYFSEKKLIFYLANGEVVISGRKVSDYYLSKDESGSYIIFKPALRTSGSGKNKRAYVTHDLDKNYISTIVERNKINILMPTEPLGQTKLVKESCR